MLFQTRKTFVHLRASRELSDSPIDSNVIITMIKVHKRSKEFGKIVHVTSGVHP